jgi:hypothetical protein
MLEMMSGKYLLIPLMLCGLRVYLEIIQFDFTRLPMTKQMNQSWGAERAQNFHRFGLYVSVGFIILFAPEFVFAH